MLRSGARGTAKAKGSAAGHRWVFGASQGKREDGRLSSDSQRAVRDQQCQYHLKLARKENCQAPPQIY